MIGPIQNRAGQIVEASVEQIKRVAAHSLYGPDFGDQIAAFGDQISPWLDLESQLVAELIFQPLAGRIPQLEVLIEIDIGLPFAIGRGQSAAGADRRDGAA